MTRLLPTGVCWCGCGHDTPLGSFFLQGHDKRAVALVIADKYGSQAQFLVEHGYPAGLPTGALRW